MSTTYARSAPYEPCVMAESLHAQGWRQPHYLRGVPALPKHRANCVCPLCIPRVPLFDRRDVLEEELV